MATSFKTDIAPMLAPYRANMMWRFDITDYNTVKQSADIIYQRLSGNPNFNRMPPPELDPLSPQNVALFKQWIDDGCLP